MPDIGINPVNVPSFDTVPRGAPSGQVDTGMYANRLGAQQSPLEMQETIARTQNAWAQTQNAQNQNKIFQMEIVGKQAMGEIMKNSMDPKTGELDYHKAALGLSTDPRTTWLAPGVILQWAQLQNVNMEVFQKQLGIASMQNEAALNAIAPLAELGTGVTVDDVHEAILSQYTAGTIKDPNIATALMTKAEAAKAAGKLPDFIKQVQLRLMGAAEAGKLTTGQLQSYEAGNRTDVYRYAPGLQEGQQMQLLGSVFKGPTVENMNTLVPVIDPNTHETHMVPRAQAAQMFTGQGTTMPGSGEQGSSAPPSEAPALPGVNEAGKSDFGPGSKPVSTQPAVQPPLTELSPEEKARLTGLGTDQGEYETSLHQGADAAGKAESQMTWMRKIMDGLKPGGFAKQYRTLGDFLDAVGAPKSMVDAASLGSRAGTFEFEKAAKGLVLLSLRQTFAGVSSRVLQSEFQTLDLTFPTLDMSKEAINNILNFMQYQGRLVQKQEQIYDKYIIQGEKLPNGKKLTVREWPAYWQRLLNASGARSPPPPTELERKE